MTRWVDHDNGEYCRAADVAVLEAKYEALRAENARLKGKTYRHIKSGHLYRLIGTGARIESDGLRGDHQAVYIHEDTGAIWVRPEEEFFDTRRFEEVVMPQGMNDKLTELAGTHDSVATLARSCAKQAEVSGIHIDRDANGDPIISDGCITGWTVNGGLAHGFEVKVGD
jgi:hypothetical protein